MRNAKRKFKNRFFGALIISVLIHLVLLSWQVDWKSKIASHKKRKSIRVVLLDEKDKKKILERKKRFEEKKRRQIVDNEIDASKKKPNDSRFLGKVDQKYDRQTVARTIGSFKKAGRGKIDGSDDARKMMVPKKVASSKNIRKIKKNKGKQKRRISLDDLSLNNIESSRKIASIAPNMPVKGLRSGDKNLTGLAKSSDFIEDVPMGDTTHLNTVEFKYFSFYERIKRKLEKYWGTSLDQVARQLYRQGRFVASGGHKITSVTVTLDDVGNIVNILVKDTSGITELDNVAVDSFNKAGPFPNPPQGMLKNGFIKIEWGFVLRG
ncbi:MAG: energy transducer TonB [Bacteriovoracaceae bacterium]|nr:energy transducer TonB [Bacteriovoracaceae bacterium]